MTLVWRNRSGEAVEDLWLHLYLNAYANNQSLHLTESKGMLRGTEMTRGYGWQDIPKVVAEVDVTDSLTFRVPRDTAPYDRTLVSVDLPAPVESGGEVEVQIEWSSRLPRVRRRSGTKGNFIFLSHWFPKLAVYEGGRGWRAHPFHMNTEFYADYGTFDVTIDLPEEYAGRVAGSGQRIGEPLVADGRAVTRFVAPPPRTRGTTIRWRPRVRSGRCGSTASRGPPTPSTSCTRRPSAGTSGRRATRARWRRSRRRWARRPRSCAAATCSCA